MATIRKTGRLTLSLFRQIRNKGSSGQDNQVARTFNFNKTESNDIVAFDEDFPQNIPESGTYIKIGFNRYLLFNNTRYSNAPLKERDGFPFPVKLTISCNDKELEKDPVIIRELLDQVYQFSRVYWKSFSQQNLPVTIKYPEMVAEIVPHFDGYGIPDFGKDNLWFL